jgi:TPR repeat protein
MRSLILIFFILISLSTHGQPVEGAYLKKSLNAIKENDTLNFKRNLKSFEILLNNEVDINELDKYVLFDYATVIYLAGVNNVDIGTNAFKKAMPYIEQCALSGMYECNFYLGFIHERGLSVTPDIEKAKYYYEIAMNGGEKKGLALNNLGWYYKTKGETDKSLEYFQRSSELGCSYGSLNLAEYYNFTKSDYTTAINLYKKAILQNHVNGNAAVNLGDIYYLGKAGPKDFSQAYQYYQLGSAKYHLGAKQQLGKMYLYGEGVKINFDSAYYYLSASKNRTNSRLYLGHLFGTKDNSNWHYNVDSSEYYLMDIALSEKNAVALDDFVDIKVRQIQENEFGYIDDLERWNKTLDAIYNRWQNTPKEGRVDDDLYYYCRANFLLGFFDLKYMRKNPGLFSLDLFVLKYGNFKTIDKEDTKIQIFNLCALIMNKEISTFYNMPVEYLSDKDFDNYPQAQFALGMIYINGIGVKPNKGKAKSYFIKAKELGESRATEILENW